MKGRNRPPRLEPHTPEVHRTPPATPEQLLERAKVAGGTGAPGRTELRRYVERIVAGDRSALGELLPIPGLTTVDAWAAVTEVFGATPEKPAIDAARTLAAVRRAVARVRAVGAAGGRVAVATAAPASLLTLHLAFVHRRSAFTENGLIGVPTVEAEETPWGVAIHATRHGGTVRTVLLVRKISA